MTTALVLHHDVESTTGFVGESLIARGIELREHTICPEPASPIAGGPLPDLGDAELLVLMGSRWSVYDPAIEPWIGQELDLVRSAMGQDVPVLGLCFGGQALAAALGGRVEPTSRPVVGWVAVASDVPELAGTWFEWHFDRFEVPADAITLASNDAAPQAFRQDRAVGLQFHPELDPELLDLWIPGDREQLVQAGVDVDGLRGETVRRAAEARDRCDRLVAWFLSL